MTKKWDFTTPVNLVQDRDLFVTSNYDQSPISTGFATLNPPQMVVASVTYRAEADELTPVITEHVTLQDDSNADPVETALTDLRFKVVTADDLSEDETVVTATSGTTTTITKTGAGYTADAKVNKILTVTAGTNSGEVTIITENTTDQLTFAEMPAACDNTTQFKIETSAMTLYEEKLLVAAMAKLGIAGALV